MPKEKTKTAMKSWTEHTKRQMLPFGRISKAKVVNCSQYNGYFFFFFFVLRGDNAMKRWKDDSYDKMLILLFF